MSDATLDDLDGARKPDPLTPPDSDLRDFRFMPLDVAQIKQSKQWLRAKRRPEIGFYSINLWMAAWHQRPVASLEDDEDVLCDAAECDAERWPQVRDEVLRGWVRCADGRIYHPIVAFKALDAWIEKLQQRKRSSAGNAKKYRRKFDPATIDAALDLAVAMRADIEKKHILLKGSFKEPAGSRQREAPVNSPDRDFVSPPKNINETHGAQGPPSRIPQGSQERGKREDTFSLRSKVSGGGVGAATPVWKIWIDEALERCPDAINPTNGAIHNTAPLHALCEPPTGPPCDWRLDVLPAIEAICASLRAKGEQLQSWTHPAIARIAIQNRNRRLAGTPEIIHVQGNRSTAHRSAASSVVAATMRVAGQFHGQCDSHGDADIIDAEFTSGAPDRLSLVGPS